MKKFMSNRTVVLAVFVILLTVAVSSVVSNAATDETPEIIAVNIVYGDRVRMAFAVNTPIEKAKDVNLYYYAERPTEGSTVSVATLLENTVYTMDGVSYPVYATHGIATKDLADEVYAIASLGYASDIPENAQYTVYSVAEYLYTRLYTDGYIAKNEAHGKEYNRSRLYQLLLEYGAQAQTVLVNDLATSADQKETLITDFVYINIVGGTMGDDKITTALYKKATEIKLNTPSDGLGAWEMTTYRLGVAQRKMLSSDIVTVTEPCVITYVEGATPPPDPTFGVAKPAMPDGAKVVDFEYAYSVTEKDLTYAAEGITSKGMELTFTDGTKVEYIRYTNLHGAVAQVLKENANSYVNVTAPGRVHNQDGGHITFTKRSYRPANYNAYVFEIDLKIDKDTSKYVTNCVEIVMRSSLERGGSYIQFNSQDINGFVGLGGVALANWNEWFTLRLELIPDDNEIRAYVKNDLGYYEYRGSLGKANSGSGDKDFAAIGYELGSVDLGAYNAGNYGFNFCYDNIKVYGTEIDYDVEELLIAPKSE